MRVAIFIDGGYLLNQFRHNKIVPSYDEMAEFFLAPLSQRVPLDLMRCYFYYCAPWMSDNPTEDEQKRLQAYESFAEELESLDRWALRQGKLERRFDGGREYFEQKRVDVLLSCDLVRHSAAGHIQHAVLVAGDSDFIPAVQAAKESGVTITLFAGDLNTVHNDLLVLSDEVHHFEWQHFPQISPKNKGQKKRRSRAKAVSKQHETEKKEQTKKKRSNRNANIAARKRRDHDGYDPAVVEAMKRELGMDEE